MIDRYSASAMERMPADELAALLAELEAEARRAADEAGAAPDDERAAWAVWAAGVVVTGRVILARRVKLVESADEGGKDEDDEQT